MKYQVTIKHNVYGTTKTFSIADVNTFDVKLLLNTVNFAVTDKYPDHHLVALIRVE